MTDKEIHGHFVSVEKSESGRILINWLRAQCFMIPALTPQKLASQEQVIHRYSRMTLFQALEYYLDYRNFPDKPEKPKGVFTK